MLSASLLAIHLIGAVATFFLIAKAIGGLFSKVNNDSTIKYLNYAAIFEVVSGGILSVNRNATATVTCSRLLTYIVLIVIAQASLLVKQRQFAREPVLVRSIFKTHIVNLGIVGVVAIILL